MKRLLAAFSIAFISAVQAQTNITDVGGVESKKQILSGAELRVIYDRIEQKRTGGVARRADSAKGWCVVVNAQTLVPESEIVRAAAIIDRQVHVQTRIAKAEKCSVETIRDDLDMQSAQVGIAVIDSPALPALLAAPEEAWAIVNVGKLKDGADAKLLASRTRREILRAFALAAGGIHAAQGDFVLQPVRKPSDLDSFKREEYGVALRRIFPLALPYYGLTPWYQTTYRKACEEGWAPQPTNEYQKAIWDKVHAIPTKPIKIEYNEKRDKGK